MCVTIKDNKKVIGVSEVSLGRSERNKYIGFFAVSVKKEYRGMGLGKRLSEEVLNLAEIKLSPKIIRLSVFSNNEIAINMYKDIGFQVVAKVSCQFFYKGNYIDEVIMIKYL